MSWDISTFLNEKNPKTAMPRLDIDFISLVWFPRPGSSLKWFLSCAYSYNDDTLIFPENYCCIQLFNWGVDRKRNYYFEKEKYIKRVAFIVNYLHGSSTIRKKG